MVRAAAIFCRPNKKQAIFIIACFYLNKYRGEYLFLPGGPLPLGKARAYEKKDGIGCKKQPLN